MVSPRTHIEKNHEFKFGTNESQLKKRNESEMENALAFT